MLNNIVITNIQQPVTVISPKGRRDTTRNRATYALSFCTKGQITYSHRGKQYISNTHTAVLLPKGQTYDIFGDKEGLFPVINFDCIGLDCEDIVVFSLQNPKLFYKDCEKITDLFLFNNKQLQIFSTFYNMLQRIMQEQFPLNHALYEALEYIEKNIANPSLSNPLIAQNVNISEVYLRKLFTQKYDISPKQYILDIRIQKAKQLLTNPLYSITAIGEVCGFSSPYAFSRCFKNKVGVSPSEYAKQNRVFEI